MYTVFLGKWILVLSIVLFPDRGHYVKTPYLYDEHLSKIIFYIYIITNHMLLPSPCYQLTQNSPVLTVQNFPFRYNKSTLIFFKIFIYIYIYNMWIYTFFDKYILFEKLFILFEIIVDNIDFLKYITFLYMYMCSEHLYLI